MTVFDCYGPVQLMNFLLNSPSSPELCQKILSSPQEFHTPSVGIYFLLFGLTFFLELLVLCLFYRDKNFLKILQWTLLVNLSTHPLVVFLFPWLAEGMGLSVGVVLFFSEIYAILFEAAVLRHFKGGQWKPWLATFTSNLISWGLGLQILKFFGGF